MSKETIEEQILKNYNKRIIDKFDDLPPNINNEILENLIKEKKDPIAFAVEHRIKIEGKDPIVFAIQSDCKIEGKDPIVFAIEKDRYVFGLTPVEYAIKTKLRIAGLDPVDFAIQYNENISQNFIGQQNIPQLEIHGLTPSIYKETMQGEIEFSNSNAAKALTPLIEDLAKSTTKGKKLSEQQVAKFYDKFIDVMTNNNVINWEQKNSIKNSDDLKKVVKETTELVNLHTPQLTIKEKLCYKISNFCKKIKLPKLSKYFMNKVKPENITKIQKTEKAIVESLKIGSLLKESSTKNLETIQSHLYKKIDNKYRAR